jgi:hypothetical protein
LWRDGTLQDFTGRIVGVSADGVVILTNQDHTSLDIRYGPSNGDNSSAIGGVLQQSNAQESDQLDVQLVNNWLSFRTQNGTTFAPLHAQFPIAFLPNPAARTTIPLDNGTLVEWDGQRITWRPHDSRMGLVLRDAPGDFFYIDAVQVDGDLILVGSLGPGQLAGDYQARVFSDFESLPRVDVLTPPVPAGYPYTPLAAPVELFYYFYQHAQDSPGAAYATPPDVPCHACYPISAGEIALANAADLPVIVDLTAAQTIPIKHLKAIGVRNEGTGEALGPQLKAAMPVAQTKGVPVLVYDDRPDPRVPQPWPAWCVFSVQCFYSFGQSPEAFVAESVPKLEAAVAAGVTCLDVAFSAFDRNLAGWPDGLLATLQSCAGELCRRVPQIVSVSFFNGGRWNEPLQVGGAYFHELIPEHRKLQACIPVGPSRWPVPPVPVETDDMANLNTWAVFLPEMQAACYCANLSEADTKNTLAISKDRFIGKYAVEGKTPQWMIHDTLVKRWPALTEAECVGPDGQPLTVHQIASGRA